MASLTASDTEAGSEIPDDDVRPVIQTGGSGKFGAIAFVIALLLGGAWIISLMSEQRAALERGGPLNTMSESGGRIFSPPPLSLPSDYGLNRPAAPDRSPPTAFETTPAQNLAPRRTTASPAPVYEPPQSSYGRPEVVMPTFVPDPPSSFIPPPSSVSNAVPEGSEGSVARVKAERLLNPSHTVPQGAIIPAVLETAIDSTGPGGVRALVQRDVHSFDGSLTLIPRGSRLYGEYEAKLQRGENRALIRWTRLIRPDGVTIALDSPASDPLGRAGVKGKVDGKFFQRFGGALLQSVLDVGVGVATREATDGVIVALPGSTQNVTPRINEGEVRPTLKVKHGTSVSVFVSRDLDFSSVE